ncbi:hypothetical protein HanXRQr2_Chr16g0776131 [Helianthus annuus]|uniref:Uncharacterized protein n=1 Tax=Helianthus annuus TaxID=4232 RepID=A0A9K3H0W4_HELAN|nr:hypothetical protein HanXRQr2_Chr16g0776131 [Helianthus annuus]
MSLHLFPLISLSSFFKKTKTFIFLFLYSSHNHIHLSSIFKKHRPPPCTPSFSGHKSGRAATSAMAKQQHQWQRSSDIGGGGGGGHKDRKKRG